MNQKQFDKGDRVSTKLGPGTIIYRRMETNDCNKVAAYSVCLDSKKAACDKPPFPSYSGTTLPASDVTYLRLYQVKPRGDMEGWQIDCYLQPGDTMSFSVECDVWRICSMSMDYDAGHKAFFFPDREHAALAESVLQGAFWTKEPPAT